MRKILIALTALIVSNAAWAAKPTVFWVSDPVRPNETIMAQGDMLDGDTRLEIIAISNEMTHVQPSLREFEFGGDVVTLESVQPSAQTGKYIVPSQMDLALYAVRPVSKKSVGGVMIVNELECWWMQGDNVKFSTPGSKFSIFGKCLSYNDNAKVFLKSSSGEMLATKISEQDLWHIDVDLESQPVGEYEVFVHNGLGGDYGWRNIGAFNITDKKAWPTTTYNVVDYGAEPSTDPDRSRLDKTNDSPAFQRALDAAGAAGGGVVFVPMGCYRLEDPIYLPKYVTLMGESEVGTNLGWVDRDDPHLGLINGTNNFAVKNLTVFVQNYWSVIRGDHGHTPDAGNITLEGVTIRANRQLGIMDRYYPENWKEMQIEREWNVTLREAALNFGGENIAILDCDVIASHSSIIIDKASGIIANSNLHCPQTFQNSQFWIRGCSNMIIVNNDIYGGGCMGNHHTTRGAYGKEGWESYLNIASENIYYAHNFQHDNWKWDREMMTLDAHGYNGPYIGPVAEGRGDSFVLPEVFSALAVSGEITRVSGGQVLSQKKLVAGKPYTIIVKMESKEEAMDWDRSFINFYGYNEKIDAHEPAISQRNGDSRHMGHGKVSGARIRGSKGFEIKDFRIADSWENLLDSKKSQQLFGKETLNGKDTPTTPTDVVFDFDSDGVLYAMVTIVAQKDPHCTGIVELVNEDGNAALSMGVARLGGQRVDFNNIPPSTKQDLMNINLCKGGLVYVLEGKGCGQYRKIVGGEGSKLLVDKPWDVELDHTSVISIHRTLHHQIFSHNTFQDGGGVQSGSVENIVANNTSLRSTGYSVSGLMGCVPLYCQFLENNIVSGAGLGGPPYNLRGGRITVEPYRPIGYLTGYQSIGIVMRRNNLESMTSIGVSGPVQNVLVENNNISHTQAGVIVNSQGMGTFGTGWFWPQDVLVRGNVFNSVKVPVEADAEAGVKVIE